MTTREISYSDGILEAFTYLLEEHPDVFLIGQGLWSPWYVGNSMKDLDVKFGKERVIDSPVSEDATTAIAGGAALTGFRPVVIHPRMDFMLLASNAMVNQMAKWSHMLGGQSHPKVTIRGIINRGGEQGAQHSQALHSWYAHIPGLRVVMPATAADARDLLVSSVLSDDPVLYIDDKWCYDVRGQVSAIDEAPLSSFSPATLREGADVSLVAAGYSVHLALKAAEDLAARGVNADVIDVRVLNPLDPEPIAASVEKTGRLLAIDGGWRTCGLAGEIIASVTERVSPRSFLASPRRITLPDAPAPTSKPLEAAYYPTSQQVVDAALALMQEDAR